MAQDPNESINERTTGGMTKGTISQSINHGKAKAHTLLIPAPPNESLLKRPAARSCWSLDTGAAPGPVPVAVEDTPHGY